MRVEGRFFGIEKGLELIPDAEYQAATSSFPNVPHEKRGARSSTYVVPSTYYTQTDKEAE